MTTLPRITWGAVTPQVIFADWHGVLCRKPYWHSIVDNSDHPHAQILGTHLDSLFTDGNREGREWMCGVRSSRTVVTDLAARHSGLDVELLLRLLAEDIADMPVEPDLLADLAQARTRAAVVLATDNIDVFASTARACARSGAGGNLAAPTLASAAPVFADVLSSSDLGVLKSQDPQRFFGPWLTRHRLGFADALLLDDRADNCAAFEANGGTALHWPITEAADEQDRPAGRVPLRRAVFLDRDGTLNADPGYLNDPARVELLPGVPAALRRIQEAGYALFVVSNQSGVGRGLITREQLDAVHDVIDEQLAATGVQICEYAICPHHPDEHCACRKPEPLLIQALATKHEIDLASSYMVGDRPTDVECGRRAGVRTCLLTQTGTRSTSRRSGELVSASLAEFASLLAGDNNADSAEGQSTGIR